MDKIMVLFMLLQSMIAANNFVVCSVDLVIFSRTTINFYLVNLSVADLLISVWCPWTSLAQQLVTSPTRYVLPNVFCKLDVFYRVLCSVASVLTLSAISFDRSSYGACIRRQLRTRCALAKDLISFQAAVVVNNAQTNRIA